MLFRVVVDFQLHSSVNNSDFKKSIQIVSNRILIGSKQKFILKIYVLIREEKERLVPLSMFSIFFNSVLSQFIPKFMSNKTDLLFLYYYLEKICLFNWFVNVITDGICSFQFI